MQPFRFDLSLSIVYGDLKRIAALKLSGVLYSQGERIKRAGASCAKLDFPNRRGRCLVSMDGSTDVNGSANNASCDSERNDRQTRNSLTSRRELHDEDLLCTAAF